MTNTTKTEKNRRRALLRAARELAAEGQHEAARVLFATMGISYVAATDLPL